MTAAAEVKTIVPRVREPDLKPASFCRNEWETIGARGTKPDDYAQSKPWEHLVPRLERRDLIWVEEESGAWVALYRVRDLAPAFVNLALLQTWNLEPLHKPVAAGAQGCTIAWLGPVRLYGVVRDDVVIHHGHDTVSEAHAWLADQPQFWAEKSVKRSKEIPQPKEQA